MSQTPQPWQIEFYTDSRNVCDVREYLSGLQKSEQATVRNHMKLLREFGVNLRKPQASPLDKPIWELRPGAHRFLYAAVPGHKFLILRAFRKKGRKAPPAEIAAAQRRLSRYLERQK